MSHRWRGENRAPTVWSNGSRRSLLTRRRDIDELTAFDDGIDRRSDAEFPARTTELVRVVGTQDIDFIAIADE